LACKKLGLPCAGSALSYAAVFQLTKREKQILAFVLLAFIAGWGFREWLSWQDVPQAEHNSNIHEFHEQLSGED